MHSESELAGEKTKEEVRQSVDDVSTGSEAATDDHSSTSDVVLVDFAPGEPADPHNWSKVCTALEH